MGAIMIGILTLVIDPSDYGLEPQILPDTTDQASEERLFDYLRQATQHSLIPPFQTSKTGLFHGTILVLGGVVKASLHPKLDIVRMEFDCETSYGELPVQSVNLDMKLSDRLCPTDPNRLRRGVWGSPPHTSPFQTAFAILNDPCQDDPNRIAIKIRGARSITAARMLFLNALQGEIKASIPFRC